MSRFFDKTYHQNGNIAFHLRLYESTNLGIPIPTLSSSIPYTILKISYPNIFKNLRGRNGLGEKSYMLMLESISRRLLDSNIASEFFYPQSIAHRLEEEKIDLSILQPSYQFYLTHQAFASIYERPIELLYFRNHMKMAQLLTPSKIDHYLGTIDRMTFENELRASTLRDAYIDVYSDRSYFKRYCDSNQLFFIQFDLSGEPVFIYAPYEADH